MKEKARTASGKGMQVRIDAAADGMRLETYLHQTLQFTKAQIRSMKFRENGLQINGNRVRITHILKAGEVLELLLEEEQKSSAHLIPTNEPIEILYEDEDVIAVWKEAGLVLHPSHGHYEDTLSNRVHAYFAEQKQHVMIRSIGRLDRDTSGIVVFAKNQVAAARLWEQKENGSFWKEYLAICDGVIRTEETKDDSVWHTITSPIAPMEGELMRMCVSGQGKSAVTHFQVLQKSRNMGIPVGVSDDQTVIRVRIETGRTHQIRVHMASIGHPLTGDVLYGKISGKTGADTGMYLCAWKTQFLQPFTGKIITVDGKKS